MSTIALTPEQQTALNALNAFISAGVRTQIGGFTLDPAVTPIPTIDITGEKLLLVGALKDVDLSKINPTISPAAGSPPLPLIASMPMSWDMKGVAQGNQAFNLVQVPSPAPGS